MGYFLWSSRPATLSACLFSSTAICPYTILPSVSTTSVWSRFATWLVRRLSRSTITHPHNLEGCQIVHLVYLQLQVCHSDLPSPHLHFLRIKCNKCIKVLPHLVTGEPMGGRVQNRTQLCHQLILTLKAFLELMRLTLRLWMTWFQAPLEKLMTLTSSSGWPRQGLNHRRREKHRHPPKHQILPLRQHQRSSPTLPRSPNRARRSPRKRSPLRWYIPTMT